VLPHLSEIFIFADLQESKIKNIIMLVYKYLSTHMNFNRCTKHAFYCFKRRKKKPEIRFLFNDSFITKLAKHKGITDFDAQNVVA